MERKVVERTVMTDMDNKKRIKGVGLLVWFTSEDINLNVPTT